jgi:hypothetical protein
VHTTSASAPEPAGGNHVRIYFRSPFMKLAFFASLQILYGARLTLLGKRPIATRAFPLVLQKPLGQVSTIPQPAPRHGPLFGTVLVQPELEDRPE